MVWPKGTPVRGKVVEVVSSGRLSRPASITLQLTQIGNSPIATEIEKIDGKSHAGRNVALIGGVAALGAILGGVAGGGKGAAIGTAAGAGAGTAAAAATGKQEIVLRAETPLTFVIAGDAVRALEPPSPALAPEPDQVVQVQNQRQDSDYYEPYAPEQLDNLLAPIALYPDPLLAQVLVAATFPDQIQNAAQRVRVYDPDNIDYQPWDISVKAVAHYPTVLAMLNDRLDWTTALGQAYVYQSTDIMASVQRLRNLAYSQGNLIATPQQQVIVDRGYIQIVPAQPRVIFVPIYDPGVIYVRRVYRPGLGFGSAYNFGPGYAIGAWLNYDLDWGSRRVVYDGWEGRGAGWREQSRPYVQVTNVYVDNRYEQVNVNRNVVDRHVDYENVKRYGSVHRDVGYENRERFESNRVRNEPPRGSEQPQLQPVNERVNDREDERGIRNQPPFRGQPPQPQEPRNTGSAPPENHGRPGNQPDVQPSYRPATGQPPVPPSVQPSAQPPVQPNPQPSNSPGRQPNTPPPTAPNNRQPNYQPAAPSNRPNPVPQPRELPSNPQPPSAPANRPLSVPSPEPRCSVAPNSPPPPTPPATTPRPAPPAAAPPARKEGPAKGGNTPHGNGNKDDKQDDKKRN